jgi:predicted CXXCH cytochrome family protein
MTRKPDRRRRLGGALLFSLVGAWALTSTQPVYTQVLSPVIAGGPHDLTSGSALRNTNTSIAGQTCIFCHVPHGGNNTIPLWNRGAPTGGAYQLYTSSTTNSTTTAGTVAASVSGACLSCHDGTIAVDVLANVNGLAFGPAVAFTRQGTAKSTYGNAAPGASNVMTGGLPFLGTDLRNDHPVSIAYEPARAATASEFVTQVVSGPRITVGATNPVPLFGTTAANATIECASCHNAHNNQLGNFLRKSNAGSAICLSCHIK